MWWYGLLYLKRLVGVVMEWRILVVCDCIYLWFIVCLLNVVFDVEDGEEEFRVFIVVGEFFGDVIGSCFMKFLWCLFFKLLWFVGVGG